MNVTSFLANGVELVKEKDAGHRSNVIEKARQPGVGFAQVCSHQRVVTNGQEGKSYSFCNCFCEGGLSIAGRPGQQDAMARL
jgi:hypothetical protein